ncbi:hypothetical protein EMPS_07184 [Entomortierella parvispora]|uniref:WSC domain-containing protein n=1 Tax=Entomortierella parvispora TaxID=205924 RepID=A0A9P3HDM9_9FUNG|nr:hypothetical protein EMPS_07184 [Entomortierella parvispora]
MPPGYSPLFTDIYMSHGACSAYCKANQYIYAFALGGTSCYCSNVRPQEETKVEESKCTKPCAGYPLEMCGSPLPLDRTEAGQQKPSNQPQTGKGAEDPVYANVILIGSTLAENQIPVPVPTPVPDPVSPPSPDTVTKITSTGVQPEERQDKPSEDEEKKEKDDDDDDGDEDDGDDDKDEEDENEGEDDDDEDGDNGGEEEDDISDQGIKPGSGKALAGHASEDTAEKSGAHGFPVASTVVAAICLVGIGAFLVYLGRKRKRERVRAAWVESVFGSGSRTGADPDPFNHPSQSRFSSQDYGHMHSPDDLDSISDTNSDMIMDRRSSLFRGGQHSSHGQDSFSHSVMVPAPIRGARGAMGRHSYSGHSLGSPADFSRRHSGYSHTPKYSDRYMEYFGESEGDQDAQLAQLEDDDICSEVTVPVFRSAVQRPALTAFNTPSQLRPLTLRPEQNPSRPVPHASPFDHPADRDQLPNQGYDHPVSNSSGPSPTQEPLSKGRHRPIPSEYRRTYSFGNEEPSVSFTPHVLEESDTASVDTETPSATANAVNGGTQREPGSMAGGLKEQLRRLSSPYVKAIRQQQLETDMTLLEGDAAMNHGESYDTVQPMPGPSERRPTKHRQVHSGSLASFRGLDDPTQPQLRNHRSSPHSHRRQRQQQLHHPLIPFPPKSLLFQLTMAGNDDIIDYTPNVVANSVVGAIYAILSATFFLKIYQNKNKWAICLPMGAIASSIGFFCRLGIERENTSLGLFIIQNILIIATPSSFLAFNYMLYGRFIAAVDPELSSYETKSKKERSRFSFIPPRIVGRTFIISDICTFLIQVTAGSMLGGAGDDNPDLANVGDKLYIAGVAGQGVTYVMFTVLLSVAFSRLSAEWNKTNLSASAENNTKLKRSAALVVGCLYFSSLFIIIRSVYRVVEYVQGHNGYLISKEVFLFVLDAVPLVLAIGVWAFVWPPVVFEEIAAQVRSQGYTMNDGQDGSWAPHNDDVPMVRV